MSDTDRAVPKEPQKTAQKTYFLDRFLEPLRPWLEEDGVSEICVNKPSDVWVERAGQVGMETVHCPEMTAERIKQLAHQVAAYSDQEINAEHPLLSAALPTGERIQFVLPPAAPDGGALSIRRQTIKDLSLGDYREMGAFEGVISKAGGAAAEDLRLRALLDAGDLAGFLSLAVKARKNIIISGGTSTGKTTFLNALSKEIPSDERMVTIEDTAELDLQQQNLLRLIASKGGQGLARLDVGDLLEASLRLRPDRILLGELRGKEAFAFLRAINTGHPGSISTIHAHDPQGAFRQLSLMVMQAGLGLGQGEIIAYVKSMIDVVVQWRRGGGKRHVSEIFFQSEQEKTGV